MKNGIRRKLWVVLHEKCYILGVRWILLLFLIIGTIARPEETSRGIYVEVYDQKARQVVGAPKPEDFQVKLNGKPVKVIAAEREAVKPKVTLVLDTSGSMARSPLWNDSFQLANDLIKTMGNSCYLSVLIFGDKVQRIVTWKSGTDAMIRELAEDVDHQRKAIGHGRTQLRDSIATAINLGGLGLGDAVIAITDGGDNHSHMSDSDLRDFLLSKGVRLYSVLIQMQRPEFPEERDGVIVFSQYAEQTGGFVVMLEQDDRKTRQDKLEGLNDLFLLRITKPIHLELSVPDTAAGKLSVKYLQAGKIAKYCHVFSAEKLPAGLSVRQVGPGN